MKLSQRQLRNIVQEIVRRKLDEPRTMLAEREGDEEIGASPVITRRQLQRLIDEEYERALAQRCDIDESADGLDFYDLLEQVDQLDEEMSEDLDESDLDEVTPPGREKQVKALKKKKGIKNPWAVAWASYNKSH